MSDHCSRAKTLAPVESPLNRRGIELSQVQNFVTLYKALGDGWTAATDSGPVGAEDITHQTWTGTTRRAMKTGVFNGRREFGE